MSQADYNIANQNGADTRSELNTIFSAIATNNSGSSEPATTFAFQWWADTTSGLLKQRNAANSAWIVKGELAAATPLKNYITFHIGGVAIDEEIIIDGFLFNENVTISKVTIFAREAPTGAAFTIDFLKAGVEQTKIATLAAGVKKQSTTISALTYTTTEEFGMKIKSVGSTLEGSEFTIIVHY